MTPSRTIRSRSPRHARVAVAWTIEGPGGELTHAASEVELAFQPDLRWLAALSKLRCREVVLTARVGNHASAKARVLELAERLTVELAASQPLVRVLFLPAAVHALPAPAIAAPRLRDELAAIGAS